MFKKLKDKIAEDLKFSPQRLTQGTSEKTQSNDENFFSIAEDDTGPSTSSLGGEFTDVNLHASTPMEPRTRKFSNSSISSDISFLPHYEPSGNLYHMHSDLDVSASEIEDNASTSSQIGHISKEQVYSAFQKAQMRYHKYRGRYTDLANHYKILENENAKIKKVLGDTQDKAIRRVSELKEQCALEQKAKAHLENALRVELDEKQIKIDTLQTKIKFIQTNDSKSDQLIDISDENSKSTSNSSLNEKQNDYQELTKYLNDARLEIENLNGKLQEMKANSIIFNTKEVEYKQKLSSMEKVLQEVSVEISQYSDREKENNLKLAQSKMELHAEIHNKDLEIANLKREYENLKHEMEKNERSRANVKLENLQGQNAKLIDKIEVLSQKCSNYESELIKVEQYKVEISNLNEIISNIKKINKDTVQGKMQLESEVVEMENLRKEHNKLMDEFEKVSQLLKDSQTQYEDYKLKSDDYLNQIEGLKQHSANNNKLKQQFDQIIQEKNDLTKDLDDFKTKCTNLEESQRNMQSFQDELKIQNKNFEEEIKDVRENAKKSLLSLETKIKEKCNMKFNEKENHLKQEFESKIEKLLSNTNNVKKIEVELMETQDLLKSSEGKNANLLNDLQIQREKYLELESNHLELIDEGNQVRIDMANLEKENTSQEITINILEGDISALKKQINKIEKDLMVIQGESEKYRQEIETLKNESQEGNINELQEKIQSFQVNLLRKDQEIDELRKSYENDLYIKSSEYNVLQTEFTLLQEVSTKQQNDNCVLKEEKHNLKKEIDKLLENISDLNTEIPKLKQDISFKIEERNNFQQQIDDLGGENAKLLKDMKELLEKNSFSSDEITKYSDENVKLKNEIKNASVTQNNLEIELDKYENVVKEKNFILEEIRREKKDLVEDLGKKKVECEKMNIILMKIEKDNEELKEEKLKLNQANETDLEKQKNREKELIEKINTLTHTLETNKLEFNQRSDQLRQCELNYQGILDENHNLKEQITKIEELKNKLGNLENVEYNFRITANERDTLLKDLENTEKQKIESFNENKKLKQEILDLKVLNEKYKNIDQHNRKLMDDIKNLQTQIQDHLSSNQNLEEELSKYQTMDLKYNDSVTEIDDLKNKYQQLINENHELLERNQQLSLDYKQMLHENEKNVHDSAELKLKYEELEMQHNNFNQVKQQYIDDNTHLKEELEEIRTDLMRSENEKNNLEKMQSSTLESSENQTSSLKNKIKQLEDEKSDYETLLNEYKHMKTEINNVTQLYDKCLKDKKDIENQLHEIERHYSEIVHEKQLLKDEIQELKISPLNLTNESKLDNLEITKTEKRFANNENHSYEIESLREKIEQYKSIDKANRSSIEFYENELQKLKIKNEKLTRRLDDTLVTLPVLAANSDFGDSSALLEYLRNVLFNYMTGKESLVLAKVIAAVCKFDKEQTELILQKEQQRQTVLGQIFGS